MSDYYAGKSCTCNAYSEKECGCGVDWTDPEIYKLMDANAKLVKTVREAADGCAFPTVAAKYRAIADEYEVKK